MKHFNTAVSIELQSKLKDFSEAALSDFISGFSEDENRNSIDELCFEDQSDFLPIQLGGFTINEFYRNDLDPSYHFTKEQTEFNQKFFDAMIEEYKVDNNLEEIDYEDFDFQEWECELFESALLSLAAFVETSGMVKLELTINYKDAPYYRSQFNETLKEMTFTEAEFLVADFDEIFKQLLNYE